MALSSQDYATALVRAAHGLDDKGVRATVERFVALLHERGLSYLLPSIVEALDDVRSSGDDVVHVESARPLKPADLAAAVRAVGLEPSAATVVPTVRPELRGGVRVVSKDRLLDATVGRRLADLSRAMGAKDGTKPLR